MSFWKVTQEPEALAIKLVKINPEKPYFAKWWVEGQDKERFVAIHTTLTAGTLGLYLRNANLYRAVEAIPSVELLVGEDKFVIPRQCCRELLPHEIEELKRRCE